MERDAIKELYFNGIKVKLRYSGVFSEKADALFVPQYPNGVALTGISAAVIHSRARQAISNYQKILAKNKLLPYGEVYVYLCNKPEMNYRYLLQVPVLKASAENTSFAISAALKKADNLELKSIVIPAVNTGRSGALTDEEAAEATFAAIASFSKKAMHVEEIFLALYEKSTYLAYKSYLDKEKLI